MTESAGYELINQVVGTANALLRESQRFFRPLGITEAQFNVLNILGVQDKGMSQRELSELLVVDRSNVTGLLDRLGKAGWVTRQDHPTDRRANCIVLTSKGRKLLGEVKPRYLRAVAEVTGSLKAGEIKRAKAILSALNASASHWGKAR